MKLKIDRTPFFKHYSSYSEAIVTKNDLEQELAARLIKRWWKQVHLKKTASESFDYVHKTMSLEQAQQSSFSELEHFLLKAGTAETTQKLLMHLEQAKDVVLPSHISLPNAYKRERQFLTAYLIATKSQFIFESPTDIDERLLEQAKEMLESFEAVCKLMSTIYLNEVEASSTPLAKRTPSVDKIFFNLDNIPLNQDNRFITEGYEPLNSFHKKQMAYYETFTEWENKNRYKLTQILINKYLELKEKCFILMNSLDPGLIRLFDSYKEQQETLKKRVHFLLKNEGDRLVEEASNKLNTHLEAIKWLISPSEVLIHELALNPQLKFSSEASTIAPSKEVNGAINALAQEPSNTNLIIDVLEEIGDKLTTFTPNNHRQIFNLKQYFSRKNIQNQLEAAGVYPGFYNIIGVILEQIRDLESTAHNEDTDFFLRKMHQQMSEDNHNPALLKEAIDYIYSKMSQINFEITNFKIDLNRPGIAQNIVTLERQEFQARVLRKQFNLHYTLTWLDKFLKNPEEYRLSDSIFCSKYLGSYISNALIIAVLQEPNRSILHTIPETFYLDRERLVKWHHQYQDLLYTATSLSYLESFCQQYKIQLTLNEVLETKKNLLLLLKNDYLNTSEAKIEHLIFTINGLLAQHKKELTTADKEHLTLLIQQCSEGTNQVSKIINKRLGDVLSYYFFKESLPKQLNPLIKKLNLEIELNAFGKEIFPVLHLHNKVHEEFYQKQIQKRLWKNLFTNFRETTLPLVLPKLLITEKENIKETHAYLHKLAFLLNGLSLLQQAMVYSDMWDLNKTIKNSTLKELAVSFGLIDMIKNPLATKETIKHQLKELIQHVKNEYELADELIDTQSITNMLRFAKTEKPLGIKAFLDEIILLTKDEILENKTKVNQNNLLAEFSDELIEIKEKTKEIIQRIKVNLLPEDIDPIATSIPLLRSGRTIEEFSSKLQS